MTFTTQERLDALWSTISEARLERYLSASDHHHGRAISLYEDNLAIAAAFYVPLQCLEITLRNRLHDSMCARFGPEWLLNPGQLLEEDGRLAIEQAISALRAKPLLPGSVVAELTFGFWVSLLASRYSERLWKPVFYRVFKRNDKFMSRKTVHGRLNALRRFRNRVAHHEPIIFNDLANTHAELIEAISWMCPITATWTAEQSSVTEYLP